MKPQINKDSMQAVCTNQMSATTTGAVKWKLNWLQMPTSPMLSLAWYQMV